MPDICDEVLISPGLELIFQKHYERIYMVNWFLGIIKRCKGKRSAIAMITERYLSESGVNMQNARLFKRTGNTDALKAVKKFRKGTEAFLEDFARLSHGDIDTLMQLDEVEARGIGSAIRSKIETIGGKPIKTEV